MRSCYDGARRSPGWRRLERGRVDIVLHQRIYYGNGNMSNAPLTPAVFHILLALADGPLHGYAIMQAVEESAGSAMGPGTIYGTLERLEASGFVKEQPASRADRRRVFALQPLGRVALKDEARRLSRLAALLRAKRLTPHES